MSTLDKRQIRRSFNRFSPTEATLEPALRLWDKVSEMKLNPKRVLDLGGDGRFIRKCYPMATTIAIDCSALALHQAKSELCLMAEAENLPLASQTVGVIWAVCVFEWTDWERALKEAARVLEVGGLLALVSLGQDSLRELRAVFDGEARVHNFVDMHEIGDALLHLGFSEPVMESESLKLTYSEVRHALRDARDMGGGCARLDRPRGMLGKKRWQRAEFEYQRRWSDEDNRVYATYELIYAIAWRREEKKEQTIQFFPR